MSVPVNMGMPTVKTPPPVLAPRRKSRRIRVGSLEVGGDAPITVQSMTTTPTSDINATLQQIAELTAAGCDIVRVAVPTSEDAAALPAIAAKSQIPVVADIHFQPRYEFAAIDAGCAAVRVNPGNIRKFDDQVGAIAAAAKAAELLTAALEAPDTDLPDLTELIRSVSAVSAEGIIGDKSSPVYLALWLAALHDPVLAEELYTADDELLDAYATMYEALVKRYDHEWVAPFDGRLLAVTLSALVEGLGLDPRIHA